MVEVELEGARGGALGVCWVGFPNFPCNFRLIIGDESLLAVFHLDHAFLLRRVTSDVASSPQRLCWVVLY